MCGASFLTWTPTYMHRVFGWKMIVVGPVLALVLAGSSVLGGICQGAIANHWFSRGRHDAHPRLYIYVAAAQSVLFLAGVAAHNPYVFLAVLAINGFLAPVTGVSASALQLVTPNQFRGQVSALFLLVFALGAGLGPSVVGALTTYVFKNDMMVGWSIGMTYLVSMPLVMLCLASAMKPMREAVAAAAKTPSAALP
jgi:MFS family permease